MSMANAGHAGRVPSALPDVAALKRPGATLRLDRFGEFEVVPPASTLGKAWRGVVGWLKPKQGAASNEAVSQAMVRLLRAGRQYDKEFVAVATHSLQSREVQTLRPEEFAQHIARLVFGAGNAGAQRMALEADRSGRKAMAMQIRKIDSLVPGGLLGHPRAAAVVDVAMTRWREDQLARLGDVAHSAAKKADAANVGYAAKRLQIAQAVGRANSFRPSDLSFEPYLLESLSAVGLANEEVREALMSRQESGYLTEFIESFSPFQGEVSVSGGDKDRLIVAKAQAHGCTENALRLALVKKDEVDGRPRLSEPEMVSQDKLWRAATRSVARSASAPGGPATPGERWGAMVEALAKQASASEAFPSPA